MIVVCDASPIINLAVVGRLVLLKQLYSRVFIPQAVYNEIVEVDDEQANIEEIKKLKWVETKTVKNNTLISELQTELDKGEAEAIALAIELKADILLLDERLGRKVASRFGLNYIGLLGILIEAKCKGFIPLVKPILDELVEKAGFWVSNKLYSSVLKSAGE